MSWNLQISSSSSVSRHMCSWFMSERVPTVVFVKNYQPTTVPMWSLLLETQASHLPCHSPVMRRLEAKKEHSTCCAKFLMPNKPSFFFVRLNLTWIESNYRFFPEEDSDLDHLIHNVSKFIYATFCLRSFTVIMCCSWEHESFHNFTAVIWGH